MTNPTSPENEQVPGEQPAGDGAIPPTDAAHYVPPAPQPQYAPPPPGAYPSAQPYAHQPQYAYPAPGYFPPGPGEPFDGAANPDDLSRPLYGATFGQAVRRYFRAYAKFDGRASRSEYWWVALFIFLASLAPMFLYLIGLVVIGASSASYDRYSAGPSAATGTGIAIVVIAGFLLLVLFGGTLVPSLAVSWRRLHDANLAGPLYFLSFIPYAGGLIVLVLTVLGSKPEGRRFDR